MSTRTPPTLVQLAGESLLRDQASSIAALEYLPAELFPPLFILANRNRCHQVLKAMTQAWPYPVLSLGRLMQDPQFNILKSVFHGLDLLLAREVRPRRWKLRVLNLRNLGSKFMTMWCGGSSQEHSATGPVAVPRSSPNMEHPLAPMEVYLDLNFNKWEINEFFMYVIHWAQQREGLVHLCCKMLRIAAVPLKRVWQILDVVQLDCIEEVEVNYSWDLSTLGKFALYLGQMRNLQRLSLSQIYKLSGWEEEEEWEKEGLEEQRSFSQFLSQMLRLQHLRELTMDSPVFLRGCLDQMFRCLQTPLDKFSITNCRHLMPSDLTHLFQCPNLRQLKSLFLFGLRLIDFHPEPLRALLEAVAPTLQNLVLDNCALVDSQVEAILPVLSCCHQLKMFSISKNYLSAAMVGKLLRHTARLRNLEHELYPVPLECYTTPQGTINQGKLALVRAELSGILIELGQNRTICPINKGYGISIIYKV